MNKMQLLLVLNKVLKCASKADFLIFKDRKYTCYNIFFPHVNSFFCAP